MLGGIQRDAALSLKPVLKQLGRSPQQISRQAKGARNQPRGYVAHNHHHTVGFEGGHHEDQNFDLRFSVWLLHCPAAARFLAQTTAAVVLGLAQIV